ncbi:MAG: hypothetical protein ACRDT8_00205 [Micromonosporaceae bacterium]
MEHYASSTTPGAIIGYTRRGPIRLMAGGSGEGEGQSGGQPAGQSGDPSGAGNPGGQGGQPAPGGQSGGQPSGQNGDGKGAPFDGPFDEQRAAKLIENLRAEAKAAKESAATAAEKAAADAHAKAAEEFKADLAKALGIVKDGDGKDGDAAAIAAERDKAIADAKQHAVELAVYRSAAKHNADPAALLDSRTFLDGLKDVEASDAEKIGAAIKAAVEANPKLAATAAQPGGQAPPPAPRGGAEPSGRPGQQNTPANLQDAIAAKYSGGQK